MQETNYIKDYLQKTLCYKCGASLERAKLETITEALISDLNVTEFKKFISAKSVSYDELLDLHKMLLKKDLWSLLDKKEKSLEKKPKP